MSVKHFRFVNVNFASGTQGGKISTSQRERAPQTFVHSDLINRKLAYGYFTDYRL